MHYPPRVGTGGRRIAAAWGAGIGIASLGCASQQTIPVRCVPETVTVYVDGEALDEVPDSLTLRADQHHVLFFRGAGYRPEMVLLESEERDGRLVLSPGSLCVDPVFLGVERKIEVEVEEDGEGGG